MEKSTNNIVNLNPNGKSYTSLSYKMIADLLNSKKTPLYIRFKLYFGILQKYGKKIFCSNQYLANKFEVSLFQVKYHLKKLKDDGSITIVNTGSFKREIVLLEYIMITDENLNEEIKKQTEKLRHSAFGRFAVKDNVYLTDEELMEIKELMKNEYVKYINNLNNYIEETGRKYKSHYEVLKAWWFKNQKAKAKKKKTDDTPQFLDDDEEYIFETYYENPQPTEDYTPLFDYDWLNDLLDNDKD